MDETQSGLGGTRNRRSGQYEPLAPVTPPSQRGQETPIPKALLKSNTGPMKPVAEESLQRRRRVMPQENKPMYPTPAATYSQENARPFTGANPPVQRPVQRTQHGGMGTLQGNLPVGTQPPIMAPGFSSPQQGMERPSVPMGQSAGQMSPPAAAPYQRMNPPVGSMGAGGMQPPPPQQLPQRGQGFGWQQSPYAGGGNPPPTPPVQRGSQMGGHGQGGQRPPEGNKKPWLLLLLVVLLVGGILLVSIRIPEVQKEQAEISRVNEYTHVYCAGVFVDGIDLGGMTQEEAYAQVMNQAAQRTGSWSVRLMYQGQLAAEINADTVGMTVDVTDALRTAWEQGHTGTVQERVAAMDALLENPYHAWSTHPSGDTSAIDALLENLRVQVYRAPQDAAIAAFNPSASDPFTYVQEVQGRSLDVTPIKAQVYEMLSSMTSGDIELQPEYLQPSVTVETLRQTAMLRGSAYTEISTTSTEDRNNNIRRAFELCTGTILKPGEVFSFNGTVGERSVQNGFFHAQEYVYDELTDGVGGGVCQASTTLMQAALKAGLKVTDHTPHSEKANYSEYGLDATVYWMYNRRIDMKFQNTTDSNIYIVCSVQSNPNNRKRLIAKVDIYGASMGDTTYALKSQLIEQLDFSTKRVRDKDKKYVTYSDEEKLVTKGRTGYVYDTYRVTYVGGVEVAREFIFRSTYKVRDEVIYYGSQERPVE